jgi:hypothetical protein
MQPKTIKSKINGCGTTPGNLVLLTNISPEYFNLVNMDKFKKIHGDLLKDYRNGVSTFLVSVEPNS